MSITPEQLAKRRKLLKQKYKERLEKQTEDSGNGSVSPEKKWERRGVRCERSESTHQKLARMLAVETSALVPQSVSDMRMDKCSPCKHVSERVDGLLFCECCGCPTWTFKVANKLARTLGLGELSLGADLQSKNRHGQHECLAAPPQFGVYEKGSNNGNSS